jgi:hypothetical protein
LRGKMVYPWSIRRQCLAREERADGLHDRLR